MVDLVQIITTSDAGVLGTFIVICKINLTSNRSAFLFKDRSGNTFLLEV